MKYLVHLRPPENLTQSIVSYRSQFSQYVQEVSKNVLHLTVMVLRINPADEEKAISSLEAITTDELKIEPDELDLFDENTLVVKVKRTPELMTFHHNVIESLSPYINWDETPTFNGDESRRHLYQRYASAYVAQFYQPHISIAQVNPNILNDKEFNPHFFKDRDFNVQEFYLSRREADGWKTVRSFPLSQNP